MIPRCLILAAFVGAISLRGETTAPPPPVFSPEESHALFEIAEPGYRIELVASEPMIQDPVAMQFDGEGRLWVVEMRGYMQDLERSGVNDPNGRVSVLEDTDQDGIMERSTVFLDDLVLPRTLAIHPDGVLIAENKPLWFVQDTDGDLVADKKTLIDEHYAKDNIEHSANGLLRAMDNWIYNAKEGHRYRRSGDQWVRDTTEKRGQWGISQDNFGRIYYNYNHSQLHSDLAPPNTLTRNPHHEPSTGLSVGVTSTNAVFPIRPNLATNRGYIPGALDENGSIKEFTSACSPFIYRETLFPEFASNAFVCGTAGNLVKRNVLTDEGLRVSGSSAYGDRDFLASKDERFRPCWITTGPDGALYIADMYRGIVQDGPHMSPYLRQHSEERKMDAPIHLGRIWRVVPENHKQPERPSVASLNAYALVDLINHRSGWWRDQAQMHLVERDLKKAIPRLRDTALHHKETVTRLHALWTLEGLRDPEPQLLTKLLDDPAPVIQAATVRVLHSLELPDETLLELMSNRAATTLSEQTRLQFILTLGDLNIDGELRLPLLSQLVLPVVADPLIRDAALSSLADQEIAFLRHLWTTIRNERPGLPFLIESLGQAVIRSRHSDTLLEMLELLDSPSVDWKQRSLLSALQLHQADLVQSPVDIAAAPKAVEHHPDLLVMFSWPGHVPVPPTKLTARPLSKKERHLFTRGRQIFLTACFACHGADGKGMKLVAPPLAGSDWVNGSPDRLTRVLLHGLTGPITVSGKHYAAPDVQPVMPPLATLGNAEIAAVLTYIRREWGNTADPITTNDINRLRIESQGRTTPWTEAELAAFSD